MRRIAVFVMLIIATCAFAADAPAAWLGLRFSWIVADRGRVVQVQKVTPGGPAEKHGMKAGDVIRAINDAPVDFGDDLDFLLFLAERKPGEKLKLAVLRDGQPRTITVVLRTLPAEGRAAWERNLRAARLRRQNASRAPR